MMKCCLMMILALATGGCASHKSFVPSAAKCWAPKPSQAAGTTEIDTFLFGPKGADLALRAWNCPAEKAEPTFVSPASQAKFAKLAAKLNGMTNSALPVAAVKLQVKGDPANFDPAKLQIQDVLSFSALDQLRAQEVYGRLLQDQFYRNKDSEPRPIAY